MTEFLSKDGTLDFTTYRCPYCSATLAHVVHSADPEKYLGGDPKEAYLLHYVAHPDPNGEVRAEIAAMAASARRIAELMEPPK